MMSNVVGGAITARSWPVLPSGETYDGAFAMLSDSLARDRVVRR